jgi:hypothetical protein
MAEHQNAQATTPDRSTTSPHGWRRSMSWSRNCSHHSRKGAATLALRPARMSKLPAVPRSDWGGAPASEAEVAVADPSRIRLNCPG